MSEPQQSLYEQILSGLAAPATPPRPPRPSAAVVPWRRTAGRLEVYWVRRSPRLRFMAGWHAFPGGSLDRSDAGVEIAGSAHGLSATQTSPAMAGMDTATREAIGTDLIPGLVAAALRELVEETGLLPLAQGDPADLECLRQQLLAAGDFAELAAASSILPDASRLSFAGRWLTPPLAPMRFDNRFFLLEWPASETTQPTIQPGELDHGEWIEPAIALARWRSGEVLAAPPIVHILKVLHEDGPNRGLRRLVDTRETFLGQMRQIEFRPGVLLLPLRTPTLPPATHTNAFLLGYDQAVLVDPASPFPEEINRLLSALTAAQQRGRRVRAIWLTHHHADHIGAVEEIRRHLRVPVLAHSLSRAALLSAGIELDGELADGEIHQLGSVHRPFPVRVLHTPGHTRGHLAFHDPTYGSLIAGDLVAGLSTIVIDPPEGDMDAYLGSLEKVLAVEPSCLFPAHGPLLTPATEHLEKLHRHRLEREAQVLAAYQGGLKTPAEMVAAVYQDIPPQVQPIAERQILAHLQRLRNLGRVGT